MNQVSSSGTLMYRIIVDFMCVRHILIHLFFKMSIQITDNPVSLNLHMRKNKVYRIKPLLKFVEG